MQGRSMRELADMDALTLRDRLASGALTATAVATAALQGIAARDTAIGAWATVDETVVMAQAGMLDTYRQSGRPLGPLIVAGGVVVVAFGLGKYIDNRHKRMLQAKLATVAQEVGVAGE